MMLLISAISVILFTYFSIKATDKHHIILPTIFGLLFLGSTLLMIANGSQHFGMKKEAVVKEQPLVSSADMNGLNILMYQSLGDGTEKVYLTKETDNQEEPKATGTDKVTNEVTETKEEAKLIQTKYYWVPKNKVMKWFFNYGSKKEEFISEKNEFYLPSDWLVLSTDQLKAFGELMKAKQATIESDAKAYIEKGIKKAMIENPQLSQDELTKLTEKLTAEFQQQAVSEMISQLGK